MHKITFPTCVRLLLGMVILSDFFLLLNNKFFTFAGYISRLQFLHDHNQFSLFKWFISIFNSSAHVIPWYYLFAIILLVTAVSLLSGIWVKFFNYISFLFFLILFICHAGINGVWLFEFVMPCGFAYLVLENQRKTKIINKGFVSGDLAHLNMVLSIICIIILSLFVCWINIESKNFISKDSSHFYPFMVGLFVFILLLLNIILSKVFCKNNINKNYDKILHQKILDKCAIFLGIMLVTQVNLDALLNWFTVSGYENLINIYQRYSSVTHSSHFFTEFMKQHSVFAVPVQASVEAFLALCLITLVFRPLSFLLSGLLFLALALIELGVPSNFPVIKPIEFAWAWDLMPSVFVMFLITYYDLRRFINEKSYKLKLVGAPTFINLSLYKRFFYMVLVCVLLFIITSFAHRNANHPELVFMLSLGAVLTVFLYLCLFHLLDILKHKN